MKLLVLSFLLFVCLPGFAQEDDEDIEKILDAREKMQKSVQAAPQVDLTNMMNEETLKEFKRQLEKDPSNNMPLEMRRGLLMGKIKGTFWYNFLNEHPRLRDFLVEVLTDKRSLIGMLGIATKKDALKLYGIFFVGLLIVRYFARKYLLPAEAGFKRFTASIFMSLFFSAVLMSFFYYSFKPELTPAIEIAKKYI